MTAAGARSPRDRYREQVRAEIKEHALRQLAEGGTQNLALKRIATELGMSGPALYRYYAGRDALLDDLVRDAYDDMAAALAHTAAHLPEDPRESLFALGGAYREWALAQPHRYLLLQGPPVPGYRAPDDTVRRARAVLEPFVALFARSGPPDGERPLDADMRRWARSDEAVAQWARQCGAEDMDEAAAGRALAGAMLAWSQLHGVVSLEITGQYAGMGHDTGNLARAQLDMLAAGYLGPGRSRR